MILGYTVTSKAIQDGDRMVQMETETKRSTIYDIANETKLSVATVSRILNRKGSYSQRSAAIVMEAVKKLGYVSAAGMQYFTPKDLNTIGLYSFYDETVYELNSYLSQYTLGALDEAAANNFDLLICRQKSSHEEGSKTYFDPTRISALVLPSTSDDLAPIVEKMIVNGVPVAYAGRRLPGDIYGNNIYGGYTSYKREVLELLYSLGYRNIAVFEVFHQSKSLSKMESFRKLLEDFRLEKDLTEDRCRMVIYDMCIPDHFQILLQSLLESSNRPDVIFIDTVQLAASAYNIIQRCGLRIPEDIGIVSVSHNERSGEEFFPMLTTVCVNAREMGRLSVKLVIQRLQGAGDEIVRDVPYQIHQRNSLKA